MIPTVSASCCSIRARSTSSNQRVAQGSLTVVPLRLYWKGGRAKIELGLAKGRTKGDKRQHMAERDASARPDRVDRTNKYGDARPFLNTEVIMGLFDITTTHHHFRMQQKLIAIGDDY